MEKGLNAVIKYDVVDNVIIWKRKSNYKLMHGKTLKEQNTMGPFFITTA